MTERLRQLTYLKVGQKYTVVGMGDFGFPYQFQMVLEEVRVEPYAQYPVSFLVIFKPRGKRLSRQLRFYGTNPLIVWEGWVAANTDMYPFKSTKDYDSGPVTMRTGYPCFDSRYMQNALDSVAQRPVIVDFEPPAVLSNRRPVEVME